MTTVNSTTSKTAEEVYNAVGGRAETKSKASTAEDLESRFLTLLMTQIKNQDPLNPLDNAQVTSQLAQLNMVTGIESLNSTMTKLLDGYAEAQGMQAAGMIGKNVMVAGNNLPLVSSKAYASINLEGKADKVTVTIKDSSGKTVQTQELGEQAAGQFFFAWDGKDAEGNVLTDGMYTFSVKAATLTGTEVKATTSQIGTVSAVTRTSSGFVLDMGDLGDVAFQDVQKIL